MAYTRSWDSTTPQGTAQVSAGDNAIRAMKEDLEERFATLVEDIDADPLVIKEAQIGTIGSKTGKILVISPHCLTYRQDEHDIEHQDTYVDLDTTETMQGWFNLPVGITITDFECFCDPVSGAAVTVIFYAVNITTGVKTDICTVTRAAAGLGVTSDPGVLATVTDDESWYGVHVSGNNPKVYGFRLTYDTPDARNTI